MKSVVCRQVSASDQTGTVLAESMIVSCECAQEEDEVGMENSL
jgi:hypothetical protein